MSKSNVPARPEKLIEVLRAPQTTEKTMRLAEKYNQYVFFVRKDSTKDQIKKAVQYLFKVDVLSIQVLNQKGKSKRFSGRIGKKQDFKKAFIRIKLGQEISFVEGVE